MVLHVSKSVNVDVFDVGSCGAPGGHFGGFKSVNVDGFERI